MHANPFVAEASTLYVVATPIGNLRDVTLRALDVLRSVDVVAAEDTRHTRQLLNHYGIEAKLVAAHEHNERAASVQVLDGLRAGRSVALVTDAGTPGISDPGAVLVRAVREAGFRAVPIPGPSALVAALSAAGIESTAFAFHGFLPSKGEARRQLLGRLAAGDAPLVFYEAPHRVLETVADVRAVLGSARRITLARELTKVFETIHECDLDAALAWLEADANRTRGEFVLIVHGAPRLEEDSRAREGSRVLALLLEEMSASGAARLAARITGARRNELYEEALRLKGAAAAPES
ncbi:MAG: 16S rRNA (cytidine(1402)-2'-O)-methyltransferase [Burkholderiales bacterium]|nr:16S rRNA (cytidine(1402)-2'-O)-methyltransferase [Burkholderiales bacterium]